MGNMFYMYYKEVFRRVRPSAIAPGLVPPFGPPRHPAFPSGHSFAGHFMRVVAARDRGPCGALRRAKTTAGQRRKPSALETSCRPDVFEGPLLWLASRLAKNRERAGLHYPSDSLASRWLAGAVWKLLFSDAASLADATPAGVRADHRQTI